MLGVATRIYRKTTMKLPLALALLALATLAGCAPTGSAVLTGPRRAAVAGSAVTIYMQPPTKRYEVVGIVSSHSHHGMSQQSDTQLAVDELRSRAGSLGANGVIVSSLNTARPGVMAGVIGTSPVVMGGHMSQAELQGTAIYVQP